MNRLDTNIKRVPKLRFKEFSSELQTLQFGDFLKSISSGKSSTRNISMGKYLFYGSTGVIGHTDNAEYVGKKILIARVGANAGSIYFADDRYAVSDNTLVVELQPGLNTDFIFYYLKKYNLMRMVFGSGQPLVTGGQIKKIQITVPKNNEQHKIAEFLTSVDERIELQDKIVKLLEKYKKGVMQKIFSQQIRFKDENGQNYPDWQEKSFDVCFRSLTTKPYQLSNAEIVKCGDFPVVDQGKSTIAGYTSDSKKLFTNGPVIVFGDHTTFLKYIDFDFVVGADGTKILQGKNEHLKYLYYYLEQNRLEPEGYKRHFSILKNLKLQIPIVAEQQKIADFLTTIDDKIQQEKNKLKQAKQFKKALLQRMFV